MGSKLKWYTLRPEFVEGPVTVLVLVGVVLIAGLRIAGAP